MPAFLVRPHYVPKPWGGRRLQTHLGRGDLPPGPVGESWEIADLDAVRSVVETGPEAGRGVAAAFGAPFPLLVKVLDAREDLSIQVHPDDQDDLTAKEEAWVALASAGRVAVGHVRGQAVPEAGAWLPHLTTTSLRGPQGDRPPSIVHVPAGTVHAILADSLVWEVQTPVDVTWRLDDHGRVGLDGRPRALHRTEAAAVLARGPEAGGKLTAGGRVLEGRRLFVATHPPGTWRRPPGCCAFLLEGGEVHSRAAHGREVALEVPPGRSVVLTPDVERIVSSGWMMAAGPGGVPAGSAPR